MMINPIPWQEILDISLNAPSGGNLQPWSVVKENNSLVISTLVPESTYIQSYDRIGAYVSIGALAYNLETVAKGFGYHSSTEILGEDTPYIKCTLLDFNQSCVSQSAIDSVVNRVTNRKGSIRKLPVEIIDTLSNDFQQQLELNDLHAYQLKFTRDPVTIRAISQVIAQSEVFRFTNALTFKKVFVSELKCKEQDSQHKIALNTLELPWILEKFLCSIIKMPALRYALLKKIVGVTVKKQFCHSSDSACIFGQKKISPIDLIKLGRVIESLWLKLTEYGYYMQPWTAFTFYGLEKNMGYKPTFSVDEQAMIDEMMFDVAKIYGVPDVTPLFLFRTLDAEKPQFHSGKKRIIIGDM